MFEATDAVAGAHPYAILGLGLVTVATRLEEPTTTTTTPPPSSSVPPTAAAPASTTSDASTTTAPAAPTTATSPTTAVGAGTPPPPDLPTYRSRLAWVGIVWGPSACTGSTTTTPTSAGSTIYIAVVIDARTGHRVLAYRSGGSAPCTGAPEAPLVTEPNELLSVPWQAVGPASTAVQIEVPPCGHYYGWTQVPAAGGASAAQIVVAVPFDPTCGATASQSQAIDQVVPLGSSQSQVGHAPVGPVEALQALPSD
jgi:hypothetical protein